MLPQAAALNGVNMNLARAVGPALGGVIVATAGAGWVFVLNAVSFVGIAAVVARWRAPQRVDAGSREHLVEAVRAGGRYVRHALIVRRLLYRAVLFIPAASAVWALLPVVASRNLGLGSAGYGLLLGMVGFGAVSGALVIPRVRARVGSARLVTAAMLVTAAAIGVIATVGHPVLVGLALVPVGGAWIAVMSSLNAGLQLALPNWVRARGLAYYLVVFQGAQALGAVIWGVVADQTSVSTALLVAAAVLVLGAVLGVRTPMPDTSKLDRTHSTHWPVPQLTFTPNAQDGPVMVTVTYRVEEHNAIAFADAMRHVGRSRRRTGALRWELFRDGSDPTRFRRVLSGRYLGRASEAARSPADGCGPQVRRRGNPLRARRTGGRAPVPAPDRALTRLHRQHAINENLAAHCTFATVRIHQRRAYPRSPARCPGPCEHDGRLKLSLDGKRRLRAGGVPGRVFDSRQAAGLASAVDAVTRAGLQRRLSACAKRRHRWALTPHRAKLASRL